MVILSSATLAGLRSIGRIGALLVPGLLTLGMAITTTLRAQVNTEAMRRDTISPGLHHRIGLDFAYQDGNAQFLLLAAYYRVDYLSGDLYGFLVGRYGRGSGGDALFRNDGFAHLRLSYAFNPTLGAEAFAQEEFNDFILLRNRALGGAGLRLTLTDQRDAGSSFALHIGVGGMYERERIASEPAEATDLIRSTNYLSIAWAPGPLLRFNATTYAQFAVAHPHDYRLLTEASLGVKLSDLLEFNTSARHRYDNEPPPGIRGFDLLVANGLCVTF